MKAVPSWSVSPEMVSILSLQPSYCCYQGKALMGKFSASFEWIRQSQNIMQCKHSAFYKKLNGDTFTQGSRNNMMRSRQVCQHGEIQNVFTLCVYQTLWKNSMSKWKYCRLQIGNSKQMKDKGLDEEKKNPKILSTYAAQHPQCLFKSSEQHCSQRLGCEPQP